MLKFKTSLKLRALEENALKDGLEYGEDLLDNGALFIGYKNSQAMMEGPGIFIWYDKTKYEGSFKANMRSGYGKIKYTNGDFYEGEWENDQPNG